MGANGMNSLGTAMTEMMLHNDISSYGLRRVHVVQMGAPVDATNWLGVIPDAADDLARSHRWVEEPLGIHHLLILWPAREVVHLVGEPEEWRGTDVLLWKLGKGESIRDGSIQAAVTYLEYFERWPDRVGVRSLPEKAADFVAYKGENETVVIRPAKVSWAPAGFLILFEDRKG